MSSAPHGPPASGLGAMPFPLTCVLFWVGPVETDCAIDDGVPLLAALVAPPAGPVELVWCPVSATAIPALAATAASTRAAASSGIQGPRRSPSRPGPPEPRRPGPRRPAPERAEPDRMERDRVERVAW